MKTIGILSPGDMGHTVGQRLKTKGLRVVAQLGGPQYTYTPTSGKGRD